MKKNVIVSSAELADKLYEIRTLILNSIVNLMKMHNVTSVDFMLDREGRDFDDEDYDENWVTDNRVWVDCYGKFTNEVGFVSEVKLGKNDTILLTAEGENDTYDNDFVGQGTGVYIDVLAHLEKMLKNK